VIWYPTLKQEEYRHQAQVLRTMLHLGCDTTLVTDASEALMHDLKNELGSSTDVSLLKVGEYKSAIDL